MIKIELEPAIYHNLVTLVIAGAKAPSTEANGIMAGAHVLQILEAQKQASDEAAAKERADALKAAMPKPSTNGHDAQAEAVAH